MSESLFPAKPAEITLDTLPQLFAHHRARFGGFFMEGPTGAPAASAAPAAPAAPERPEGISEEEWSALGDPGRNALAREREARQTAERALAASRARPTPPAAPAAPVAPAVPAAPTAPAAPTGGGEQDLAAIVQQAVQAAVKPFVDRETERESQAAAERIQTSVLEAAEKVLHDKTDVLSNVDLTTVVNDKGEIDTAKVTTALEDLVKRKPHLAKSTTRLAPPGIGGGLPATATDAEKVKAVLAEMQRTTGVRIPSSNS